MMLYLTAQIVFSYHTIQHSAINISKLSAVGQAVWQVVLPNQGWLWILYLYFCDEFWRFFK
jgi:SMC interacting uncharacterized protein involved in chromosome segregation